ALARAGLKTTLFRRNGGSAAFEMDQSRKQNDLMGDALFIKNKKHGEYDDGADADITMGIHGRLAFLRRGKAVGPGSDSDFQEADKQPR
ncbi:MAG: hypothetical protein KHZ29_11700, partial [Desulfovibrionaceae bacterium]|nr:hypothetical protein [Desulfovibrionaceae bacterium]